MTELATRAYDIARYAHREQVRKGSNVPYISHPTRVSFLLGQSGASSCLVASGYLHDVIEDTDYTEQDLREIFPKEVVDLVLTNTEDKTLSWEERKQATIDSIKTCSQDTAWLILADKYDNLLDTFNKGEDWSIFKRGKEEQEKYFRGILNNLSERKDIQYPNFYEEYKDLVNKVF